MNELRANIIINGVVQVGVYLFEHTVPPKCHKIFYSHLRFYMAITNCIEMKFGLKVTFSSVCFFFSYCYVGAHAHC